MRLGTSPLLSNPENRTKGEFMTDSTDNTRPAPLSGLVVIDLSTTLAGAQATQFLADSGADVILVEPPEEARCVETPVGRVFFVRGEALVSTWRPTRIAMC
ncbi:hypothetical protein GCM10020255_013470 [Rhodococcus baikonurensis]